ncbi:MAG: glucosaminidase domain-containing protein [Alistipes sp.]|nr:glucosaminidase domain-containing protein [Alistipes sp.]
MLFRVCIVLLISLFSAVPVRAQVSEPDADKALEPVAEWVKLTPEEYIYRWRATAVDNMEVYGIPASITMAQAILESGFGNGYLAHVANNHFCIKCKKSWTGRTITHADDRPDDCFRVYDSVEESFEDHANFLCSGQRYEFLFAYDTDDYKSWAKGLKQAGYATAPDYAERLIGVVERYNLQLLDKKNGIQLYDEYLAKELGVNVDALAESSEVAPKEEAVAAEVNTNTVATEADVEYLNIKTAYSEQGVDPNNYRVTINSHRGYNVYRVNGTFYIIANEGDTFESLGELFELSSKLLRRFNDLKGDVQPTQGDIIYIEPKMMNWSGEEMAHIVTEGQTMRDIAQMYGIRLKALERMNKAYKAKEIVAGQSLRLR